MNYFRFIYITLFGISLGACELTDVTDIVPPYQLNEETVITDIKSAGKVLTGSYAQLHQFNLIVNQPGTTGCMGLSFLPGPSGGASYEQFYNNSVTDDNYILSGVYTDWYFLINMSSHVIQKTSRLNTDDPRKDQIIGEASFLRALSHFYLLRWFGRFYDINSEYGIVTWNEPVKDIKPKPRSTVKESYDQILTDLDYAIAHAPEYTTGIYASRQAAMVLKAKVLLYKKDYAQAAIVAGEAIQQKGAATLEPVFDDVFKNWFRSKEVLMAPPFDDKNERNNKAYAFRAWVLPTPYYFNFMEGDSRQPGTVYLNTANALRSGKFQNTTAGGQSLTANTEYYLRLAEVYLIQAESLVRSSNGADNFQKARDAINVIRGRVNEDLIENTVNTKASLLEVIRKEKQLELGCESGEEWYDLVRFATEGDLLITDYKPNVVNETRYIVPIPAASIKAGGGVVVQNPS